MSEEQKSTILSNLDPELVARIQKLLRHGGFRGRVESVQLYMRATKVGLKDAKSAIDKETEFLGIPISIPGFM